MLRNIVEIFRSSRRLAHGSYFDGAGCFSCGNRQQIRPERQKTGRGQSKYRKLGVRFTTPM